MKTQRTPDVWRFGLMLVLLCICSIPNLAGAAPLAQIPTSPVTGYLAPGQTTRTPDYYTTANWANSPPLAKFVDTLPGLTAGNANSMGQYLSVAKPDTVTYPGSDYYEIDLIEYRQRLHPDLPATKGTDPGIRNTTGTTEGTLLRGYVQVNNGTDTSTCGTNCTVANNTLAPDPVKFLGPNIVAFRDRPVRIKFRNRLPAGEFGDLFIPVDTSVMGAGIGPAMPVTARGQVGLPCDSTLDANIGICANYTQNRSDIHLHGGRTPWISDGTPHQWITPVEEITPFTKGVSIYNVPDMPDPGDGATTYYYSNQQSARLLFYHEHAWGITRLNPYVGVAAGYIITDQWEQDLITRGILPLFLEQIPLVIQDRTFVDATPVTNPVTGEPTTQVRVTDPLWNWGSATPDANGIRKPVTGDLWMPHVYMPAQTQVSASRGANPFGRWMYGPWFYPATIVSKPPIANPYYDPNCSSTNPFELALCQTPGQPTQIPGTPNISMGMEAFQDSAMVNGAVFPSLTVDPRAYRFRILNAANDRFWNLSFYKADPLQISPDPRALSPLTEVKMVPAAVTPGWPALWPTDGREGGVPDPGTLVNGRYSNWGPSFLQIGTEGGFLPQPVEIVPQPITYNTDPTAFWVGNVNKMGLALGPAERADVIVDFSQYAGQTLILYNDAPAAWPAGVANYDYYTGAPDQRDTGGYGTGGTFNPVTGVWDNGTGPLVGYAPNTRTVMQVIVRNTAPAPFNRAALEAEFAPAPPVSPVNPAPTKTLFERSQEPIIVGQPAYSTTYPNSYFPTNFPWEGIAQINDQSLNFVTIAGQEVSVPTEPKGLHDEMGASFDPVYGRMSGNLGMQLPNPTTLNALLVLYGFSDVPTEFIPNSTTVNVQVLPGLPGQPGTVTDGTQIWKISHNGVDTHPIHFHIFDVQLINRVGWDGQILLPEPNELGWKDTVKISPLEDTIVAVRPRAPLLPFGLPDSLRPLNPAIPIDSAMGFGTPFPTGSNWPIPGSTTGSGFSSIDWQTGQAYVGTAVPPYPYPNYKGVVTNVMYNFGWEYVWHCHILSHEEMDMMRPIILNYTAMLPPAFSATATPGTGNVVLNWNDPTPVALTPAGNPDLTTYGNPANEIGFNIYRTTGGAFTLDPTTGSPVPLNNPLLQADSYLRANSTSYTDASAGASTSETYVVEAFNAQGATVAVVGSLFSATVATTNGPTFISPGPVNLQATIGTIPAGFTVTQVAFYDGATLIGTVPAPGPYTLVWNNVTVGSHSITARVSTNFPAVVVVSAPIDVVVGGTLSASFTPANGSVFGVCDTITFTSTSTGTIAGYSWLVDTTVIPFPTDTLNIRLAKGIHSVTLGINNAAGETAQITQSVTVASHLPTANTGGPYTVLPGANLILNGSGTNTLDPCSTMTAYGWDLDNKTGYEYSTANPTIPYDALMSVLGVGTHTVNFMVTDSSGGVATSQTTITVAAPEIRMRNNTSGNYTYYANLQSAYAAALNNSVVELTAGNAIGGLVADRNITVTFSGGMNPGFTAVTGVTTINNTVTVRQGKVVMRNVRLLSPYPTITTPNPLPSYTIGSGAYSTTLTSTGGVAPYTYAVTAGVLPDGLTLTSGGLLSGTPTTTTPLSSSFTVTVTDSATPSWSSSTAFTLDIIELVSIAVSPVDPSVAVAATQQMVATGTYSDASTADLTALVVWGSATPGTATVSTTGLVTGIATGTSAVTATLGLISGNTTVTIVPAPLVSIAVTPASPTVAYAGTQQMTATGTYADASTADLTALVTWGSATPANATVNATGLVTGVTANGTSIVSATLGLISGNTTVTVAPAPLVSIAVTPATPTVAYAGTQQMTATGTYADASTADLTASVTWDSATPANATVSATGLVTGVTANGTSVVSATLGLISGNTTVTVAPAPLVSIAVTPATPTVAYAGTQQMTATGTYADASTADLTASVTWDSATPANATVSATGLVTGVTANGTSVVSATLGLISGNTTVTIAPAPLVSIAVTPVDPTLATTTSTQQMTATGTFADTTTADLTALVTWGSATPAAATIDLTGLVTGVATGTSLITATQGLISGTSTVTVP